MSHTSLGDNQGQRRQGDSSDSEHSDNTLDETQESLQDEVSSLESQPSSVVASNSPAAPSSDTQVIQKEKISAGVEESTARQSDEALGNSNEGQSSAQKSTCIASADTPPQHPVTVDAKSTTSQSRSGKGTNDAKNEKTDVKNSQDKKDKRPTEDQNANTEQNEKQSGATRQKRKAHQQPVASEQKMVFGPQPPSKVKRTTFYQMI